MYKYLTWSPENDNQLPRLRGLVPIYICIYIHIFVSRGTLCLSYMHISFFVLNFVFRSNVHLDPNPHGSYMQRLKPITYLRHSNSWSSRSKMIFSPTADAMKVPASVRFFPIGNHSTSVIWPTENHRGEIPMALHSLPKIVDTVIYSYYQQRYSGLGILYYSPTCILWILWLSFLG